MMYIARFIYLLLSIKSIIFHFLLLCFSITYGQHVKWAHGIGGVETDEVISIDLDSFNNLYLAGTFKDSVDFNPGQDSSYLYAASSSTFIQKMSPTGDHLWVKKIGGGTGNQTFCAVRDFELDQNGNIYLTGWFKGTIDFDPGSSTFNLSAPTIEALFICKLDTGGTFLWAKKIETTNARLAGNAITTDSDDNIYCTGFFSRSVDFDPGPSSFILVADGNRPDAFLLKLNAIGGFVWAKQYGGTGSQLGGQVKVGKEKNVYTVGRFQDTLYISPNSLNLKVPSRGWEDSYISKLDSLGNHIWTKSFGGWLGNINIIDFSLDKNDNIILAGIFENYIDFDLDTSNYNVSVNDPNVFICKMDKDANFDWVKYWRGKESNYNMEVTLDIDENIISTGSFHYGTDLDPGTNTHFVYDTGNDGIFVNKLDSNGNFNWGISIGGDGYDNPSSVITDKFGNLIVGGTFDDTINVSLDTSKVLNLIPIKNSRRDFFIEKISFCDPNITSIDTISSCGPYTWIDGNTYVTSNDTSTWILTTSSGCDSIVTLKLNIVEVDTSVIELVDTLRSNLSGASYQWLDCNNSFAPINGATSQTFLPSKSGSYAVEISFDGCTDTSSCYISSVGIKEHQVSSIVKLMPNPSQGLLFMESKIDMRLIIFNSQGSLISEEKIKNGSSVIKFPEVLVNGVYWLVFSDNNGNRISRMVVLQR